MWDDWHAQNLYPVIKHLSPDSRGLFQDDKAPIHWTQPSPPPSWNTKNGHNVLPQQLQRLLGVLMMMVETAQHMIYIIFMLIKPFKIEIQHVHWIKGQWECCFLIVMMMFNLRHIKFLKLNKVKLQLNTYLNFQSHEKLVDLTQLHWQFVVALWVGLGRPGLPYFDPCCNYFLTNMRKWNKMFFSAVSQIAYSLNF